MKQFTLTIAVLSALCAVSFAGPEQYSGKEMKQVAAPAPCPEWYSDNEWNVNLWGAYAFVGTDNNRSSIEASDDFADYGTYDRFLAQDHAWGGGIDAKYFFKRYFGLGVEGFGLFGRSLHGVLDHGSAGTSEEHYNVDHHTVGGALGTFTLRYPFHCSRFSPYAWAGGGMVFNGSNDRAVDLDLPNNPGLADRFVNDDKARGVGQFGGGLEVRLTRHIGLTTDFSWNVVGGPHNNFGMVRTGLNFAF